MAGNLKSSTITDKEVKYSKRIKDIVLNAINNNKSIQQNVLTAKIN